jgi:hypothetical protein
MGCLWFRLYQELWLKARLMELVSVRHRYMQNTKHAANYVRTHTQTSHVQILELASFSRIARTELVSCCVSTGDTHNNKLSERVEVISDSALISIQLLKGSHFFTTSLPQSKTGRPGLIFTTNGSTYPILPEVPVHGEPASPITR